MDWTIQLPTAAIRWIGRAAPKGGWSLCLIPSLIMLLSGTAKADLNLGTAANYSVVALGSGKTIGLNSGPNDGSFLLGNGVTANFSGGNNGSIAGTLFYDDTTLGQNTFSKLQTPPTTQLVAESVTTAALNSANAVGAYAAMLTPTQTFTGTISSATMFTGNGGLNIIDVNNIQNAPLTISGTAADTFVINVAGTFNTNVAMTLTGVTAAQILWNFTGTSGNVFSTSGGNTVFGTFLATDGGSFQFSNLNLTGALINTAGNMQIVSGSKINSFVPLPPGFGSSVPEPSEFVALSAMSLVGLGFALLYRRRAKAA